MRTQKFENFSHFIPKRMYAQEKYNFTHYHYRRNEFVETKIISAAVAII